jgi:DNA-directed RNA polymerase specialized sigma24 family protein
VLTGCTEYDWTASWPQTAGHLRRFLTRLGANSHTADDLVQEVAVRLIRSAPPVADDEELLRWCYVVVRRLYVDHLRGHARLLPAEQLGRDFADAQDVHRVVEGRLMVARVGRALRELSEADRETLLRTLRDDDTAPPASRRDSTRLAVQRHRARNRLDALLAGSLSIMLGFVRGLWRTLRQTPVAAAFVLPALVLTTSTGIPAHPGPATRPTPAVVQGRQPVLAHRAGRGIWRRAVPHSERTSTSRSPSAAGPAGPLQTGEISAGVGPERVRSGTSTNPHGHLLCAGVGAGLPDVCLPKPAAQVRFVRPPSGR